MRTELILDEEGLRVALSYYLYGMHNKTETGYYRTPVDPARITGVEIQPRVKRVKIIFEVVTRNDQPKSDALR